MNSRFILWAIRQKYPTVALVPEVTIDDMDLPDSDKEVEHNFMAGTNQPDGHKYNRRIDALMFESLIRTAIEVKTSVADFKRDTYWKRRMWQRHTHRFIYAVPHDLPVMAPHGCGLWRVHENGRIEIGKKAILNRTPDPLPQTVVQRLAYRATPTFTPDRGEEQP